MPDSPNPSSTQEVERLRPLFMRGPTQGPNLVPDPAGDFVSFEDHQRLLQAVEEERDTALLQVDGGEVMRANLWRRVQAAESKLSSVVEEVEGWLDPRIDGVAFNAYSRCLRLLRD